MKRYMILAFVFSVLVRCFYFYEMSSNESYLNNGVMMLNTQDAYHYAKGVRDILEGQYVAQGLSQLGAVLSFILPFGFESVMLWMSAIFGSLIVVPLVLIGKEIGDVKAGFIASLVASVSIAYYSRTTVGYFDTDMLNLFFPLMLVWLFMVFLKNRDERYILLIALDIVFYR